MMFSGMSSLLVMCHPALSRSTTACAPLATLLEISSRWSCIIAWRKLTAKPETITSIGMRDWAHVGQSL